MTILNSMFAIIATCFVLNTTATDGFTQSIGISQMFLPLAIVMAIIFLMAWLVKKFGKKLPILNNNIKIISVSAISNQAKLVLVNVNNTEMLIGVTNQKINLIKNFSNQEKIKLPKNKADPEITSQFSKMMDTNKINDTV